MDLARLAQLGNGLAKRRAVNAKRTKAKESTEGGYETFGALKGACYGLQKKTNDSFTYQ